MIAATRKQGIILSGAIDSADPSINTVEKAPFTVSPQIFLSAWCSATELL